MIAGILYFFFIPACDFLSTTPPTSTITNHQHEFRVIRLFVVLFDIFLFTFFQFPNRTVTMLEMKRATFEYVAVDIYKKIS